MKLIVGLGNPGNEYEHTRHNIGFSVIDSFAHRHNIDINKRKFGGLYNFITYDGEKVFLLKPMEYINLSGEVIKKFISYFDIAIDDILIISDDLDLPFLKMKLKKEGSSGGHNGLKNIELNLNTSVYKRMKVGISNDKMMDTKDYVLSKLGEEELTQLNEFLKTSDLVLDDYLSLPFEKLMSKYN